MKVIETRPREIGFVLWGHCQNLLDDPRRYNMVSPIYISSLNPNFVLFAVHLNVALQVQ